MIRRNQKRPHWPKKLFILVVIVSGVYFAYTKFFKNDPKQNDPQNTVNTSQTTPEVPTGWQPAEGYYQGIVEKWAANHKGDYSIVITTPSGRVLASYRGDTEYFTASLYKLFVIYEAYQRVDDGTYSLDEPYLNGWTRGKCVDEAIRSSYSPCAEKLWNELGKESLTTRMEDYGLTNTSLVGLSTSANDVAIILRNIEQGKDLSQASQAAYLDSMKTQEATYRRGLPAGFEASGATVYNKVGWNGYVEWHDGAIVDFGGGKKLIVTVLSENAGIANIVDLAKTIAANLPE